MLNDEAVVDACGADADRNPHAGSSRPSAPPLEPADMVVEARSTQDLLTQQGPIRSVQRALHLVRIMNLQEIWTLRDLADRTGLAKTTVHRLLATLERDGYVYSPPRRAGMYRLTMRTRDLSAGLTVATHHADAADPIIRQGTQDLQWPVSFAIAKPPFMRIIACGMPYLPQLSAKPTSLGNRHWIFSSAVGRAYLSRCAPHEVALIHAAGQSFQGSSNVELRLPALATLLRDVAAIQESGYAVRLANRSDLNSAIAVPVVYGKEVFGSLACSTFPHSLSTRFIARVFEGLRDTADALAAACAD